MNIPPNEDIRKRLFKYKLDDKDNKNNQTYYLHIHQKLNDQEIKQLTEILSFFPDSRFHSYWRLFSKTPPKLRTCISHNPNHFFTLDTKKFPEYLLKIAANAYDSTGYSMLGNAAAFARVDIIEKLISFGADVNILDIKQNKLPLYWAISAKER